jgi:hypothetical protein
VNCLVRMRTGLRSPDGDITLPAGRSHRAFRAYQIVIWKEKAVVEELNRGLRNEAARGRYVRDLAQTFCPIFEEL